MRDFHGERRNVQFGLKLRHHIGASLADCALKAAFQPVSPCPPLLILCEEEIALGESP
jgi:hypothetical protein